MRLRTIATRSLIGALAGAALLFGFAGPAQAYPGSGDDRMSSAPTSWWTYQGVTPGFVATTLSNNHARLTDLRVTSTSPLLFSVTEVDNTTGPFASAWWWYYGVSLNQVNSLLGQNNARLISAVRYGDSYAVVMVSNTGANAKAWGWCDTNFAGVISCMNSILGGPGRLTNIQSYAPDRFVTIFVDNGENLGWCWFAGISRAALNNVCNGMSLLDITANPDGSFNVAAVAQNGDGRVHDFGSPGELVSYALAPPPDRPLFVQPYVTNGTTRWITSFRHNS